MPWATYYYSKRTGTCSARSTHKTKKLAKEKGESITSSNPNLTYRVRKIKTDRAQRKSLKRRIKDLR